jgi:hypothetical protein
MNGLTKNQEAHISKIKPKASNLQEKNNNKIIKLNPKILIKSKTVLRLRKE